MISKEDQEQIRAFVANPIMFEAVRRVLLQGMLGDNFATENWVFALDKKQSDSTYGKEVKVTAKALEWLNKCFIDLKRIGAVSNPQPDLPNGAR
jgi:hypothetical protein